MNVGDSLCRTYPPSITIRNVHIALCLVLLSSVASAQSARPASIDSPSSKSVRPFILFVHGRAQMGRPDTAIVNEWVGAFKSGLRNAGDSSLVGPEDAAFVMYQHFFENPPRKDVACQGDRAVAPGLASAEAISSAFREAKPHELAQKSPSGVLLGDVRAATNRLPSGLIHRAGIRHTDDTKTYLNFSSVEHCSVQQAIEHGFALAGHRPVIVIAHSMGTLAVYRYLLSTDKRQEVHIARLITLGSQLGFAPLAGALSGKSAPPFPYPKVDSWVNIHDVADPLAWPTFDARRNLFDSGGVARVPPVDVPINLDAAWHHAITAYLQSPIVVRAIAAAWCGEAVPQPVTCKSYQFGDVGPGSSPPPVISWNDVVKRTTRFGLLGGSGAALGAWTGLELANRRQRGALIGAGIGAIAGSFLSVAWDHWFPNI